MKKYRFIIPVLTLFLLVLSCKKNKPDERIFARWKIAEYYLDGQPAYDTITKYLSGLEYEIGELNKSSASYAGGNAAIKIYGPWQNPIIQFEDIGKNGLSMYFYTTTTPPPVCENAPTAAACFECPGGWSYTFANDNQMEWTASNSTTYPISHQHRLVFVKVG